MSDPLNPNEIAEALRDVFTSPNLDDPNLEFSNPVDALNNLARAIRSATRDLGTGNAGTPMGALEYLAVEIKEGSDRIAGGLHAIAEAILNRG